MPKVVSRVETSHGKVSDGEKRSVPVFQSFATIGHKEWFTIPIQPTAPTNAFSSAPTTIYYDIEPHDAKEVKDLCIRLTLSASGGDVRIVGAPFLFDTITLISNKGSGDNLVKLYAENIIAWCMLTMNDEEQQQWSKLMNFSLADSKSRNLKKYWYNESNYIRDGETRQIYMPLPLNFVKMSALDLSHLKNPLRLRFECSNDVVIDGSVNNLSLDNIELLVCGHQESAFDMHAREARNKRANHAYNFLDVERITINDRTLNASTKTDFFLDQLTSKVAFFLVCIKGNTNPANSDDTLFDYLEIGKNGTFDIESSSGRSEYCNGNPVSQTVLYHHLQEQLQSKPFAGMYIIPFCEDIKKSIILGNINGFKQMTGAKEKLSIVFDSAPTSEVQTISIGTTATAGTYRYAFENFAFSDQEVDYNDSTSDLLSAINAIPYLQERNYTASSVANNINTSASHAVTFTNTNGNISNEVGKITIVGNGIPKVNSTSVTTYGDDGWASGSNYEVSIYAYKWAKFCVDNDGELKVEQL